MEEVNKGGRPRAFDNPKDLENKINEYFGGGAKEREVLIGKSPNQQMVKLKIYTITGLANYLGFESRQSFYDYEKEEGFSYIIKKARLQVEQHYEEELQIGNSTGAIFALKNMGWSDRMQTDITSGGEKVHTITGFEVK